MIPGRELNGVSGREEVIKLFIVTDGAECAMLVEVVGPSGGTSGVQNKTPSEPLPEGPLHDQVDTFTVTPHCG